MLFLTPKTLAYLLIVGGRSRPVEIDPSKKSSKKSSKYAVEVDPVEVVDPVKVDPVKVDPVKVDPVVEVDPSK